MAKSNAVEYKSYSFSKDLPADTDLTPDGQRRKLAPLDEICEGAGGLFLRNTWDGLKWEQLSRHYLVSGAYVDNRIVLDGSGNSPKRHSMGTTVIMCAGSTEDMTLFQKFMDFYGAKKMPPVWTDNKSITY